MDAGAFLLLGSHEGTEGGEFVPYLGVAFCSGKLYNNKIKAEEKAKEEEARIEAKRKKNHERLMKYIAKKEKEAREARINELAEAIVRAGEIKNNIPYAIEQSCTNADNEK